MTRTIVLHCIVLLLLVVLHMNVPQSIGDLGLMLPLLWIVLAIIFSDRRIGAPLAIGTGVFLDLNSSLPFGVYLLSFTIVALSVESAFKHLFTNRSFYATLMLGLSATVAFRGLSWGSAYLLGILNDTPPPPLNWFTPWQLLLHAGFLLFAFYVILGSRNILQRYFFFR